MRAALTIAGHVRAFLHRRLHEAASLHERALSLNPNLAMAWALSAIAYAYMGEPEEAERRNNRYKKLSPLDPHAFFFDAFFILIHLMKRDYESAVAVGRAVSEMNPSFSATYKPYLAALGHLGGRRKPRWCGGGCCRSSPTSASRASSRRRRWSAIAIAITTPRGFGSPACLSI